jgi:chromosome segregation ATPase
MANIVQHRRGTTEEWEASLVIPAAGELIIEECSNNSRKCKIGDGIHTFSDLGYVDVGLDGEVKKEIFDTLSSSNAAMSIRVEALEAINHNHNNKQLLDTYTQTNTDLADAVVKRHEHIFTDEDVEDAISKKHVHTFNEQALNEVTLKKIAAWDASETNAKIYADSLANDCAEKIHEHKITDISELGNILKSNADNIQENLDRQSKIEVAISDINDQIDNLDDSINSNKTKIKLLQTDSTADRKSIVKLQEQTSHISTDLNDVLSIVNDEDKGNNSLSERITANVNELVTLKESNKTDLTNINNYLNINLKPTITSLAGRTTALEKLSDENKSAVELNFNSIKELIEARDALSAAINSVETILAAENPSDEANNAIQEIRLQLESKQTSINDLYENHNILCGELYEHYNTLTKEQNSTKEAIGKLSTKIDSTTSGIQGDLAAQQAISENTINLLNIYVRNIYAELLDLVDDDIVIIEKVFAVQNTLTRRINTLTNNKTELSTFNETISEINSQLVSIRAIIEGNSDEKQGLVARISDLEDELLKFEDTINRYADTTVDGTLREDFTREVETIHADVQALTSNISAMQETINDNRNLLEEATDDIALAVRVTNRLNGEVNELENNVNELENNSKNFIKLSNDTMLIDEDVIIFNCGDASNNIFVD